MMNWHIVSVFSVVFLFSISSFAHKPSDDARFCALATTLSDVGHLDQPFQGGGGYTNVHHVVDKDQGVVMLHFRHGEKKESLVIFQVTKPRSPHHTLKDLAFLYGINPQINEFFEAAISELVKEGDYDRLTNFYDFLFPGQSGLGHLNNRANAFFHTLTQSLFVQYLNEVLGFGETHTLDQSLMRDLKAHSQKRILEVCQRATDFCLDIQQQYPTDEVQVMGHHLGGFVAQYVAAFLNLSGCSFGAPGAEEVYQGVFGERPDDQENKRFICYQRTRDVITKLGTPMGTLVDIDVHDTYAQALESLSERTLKHNNIEHYAEDLEPFEKHPLERVRVTPTRARSEADLPLYIGEQNRSTPRPPSGSPPPDRVPVAGSLSHDDDGDPEVGNGPIQSERPQLSFFAQRLGLFQRFLSPHVTGLLPYRFLNFNTKTPVGGDRPPSDLLNPGLSSEIIDNPDYKEEVEQEP